MNKLITEEAVRQLVKTNSLSKNSEFLVAKGTILTPSARGFLIDHQIKIKNSKEPLENSNSAVQVQKAPIFTQRLYSPKVDFQALNQLSQPVLTLKIALRKQTIVLIEALSLAEDLNGHDQFTTSLIEMINGLLQQDFYEYQSNPELAKLDLTSLKFTITNDELACLISSLQTLVLEIAVALNRLQLVYPVQQLASFNDISMWEEKVQEWIDLLWEEGENNE